MSLGILQVPPHLPGGVDVVPEGGLSEEDVGLGGEGEGLQSVDLGREGQWRRYKRIIQNIMLLMLFDILPRQGNANILQKYRLKNADTRIFCPLRATFQGLKYW